MKRLALRCPADYYSVPVLNNGGLNAFKAKLLGLPGFSVAPSTLRTGQLVHLAVYQPALFALVPSEERTNAIYRIAANAKKCKVLQSFLRHPKVRFEEDVYALWNDEIPVKVKPDAYVPTKYGHDLKTTACKSKAAFLEAAVAYGYFRQVAFYAPVIGVKEYYLTGVSKNTGETFVLDMFRYKALMKEARAEVVELIRLFVAYHPKYISTALPLFTHETKPD